VTSSTTLQEQARALGDPTRHGVFRYVADADRPVDVSEMAEHFALNHNAIRQHLAKLVDAGLVVEEKAPSVGRGRPRLVYLLDPTAESRWGVIGPYERLSLWLAEIVRTGDTPVEVGRRAGRRQRLGTKGSADPVSVLVEQMARHGFDPTVRQKGGDVDITLRTCPFSSTALADPDTVCELHLGMAQGIAEGLDGLEVDELVPKDPRRAHCRLRCHLATP
jgi:predicted ArsR family transcriptional regulator